MQKECSEIIEMFKSLNSLSPKEWRYIIRHTDDCNSCKLKLVKKMGSGKSGGNYSKNIYLITIIKLRNSFVRDIKGYIWELHECEIEKNLINSFGEKSINKLTPEEWEKIFEHNDDCKICQSINVDFENTLRSTLTEVLKKPIIQ